MEKDTIVNALKGVAIGDAFGVGIEFKSRFWMAENVKFDQFVNVWKDGKNNILPGTYSDDTEHTIGVVEALLSDDTFSEELLLAKFIQEYENDKQAKGYPRDGHGSIEDWYTGRKTIAEVRAAQVSRSDPGNAPVMRAVPLAFVPRKNLLPYCTINANSTHPHELGRLGSYLTALTAWHFLREDGDAGNLIQFLIANFDDAEIKQTLQAIDELPAPYELSEDDYLFLHGEQPLPYIKWDKNIYGLPCACLKTAYNAVYVLRHSWSPLDALRISINMGGDVDSLAAVCVGIATGRYGLRSLPKFLLEKTEGLARMEDLGEKMYQKFFSDWCDTKEGISESLETLEDLMSLLSERRTRYFHNEQLHEFFILGRYLLDGKGEALKADPVPKDIFPDIPNVLTKEEFKTLTGSDPDKIIDVKFHYEDVVMAPNLKCPFCGTSWNIDNIHEAVISRECEDVSLEAFIGQTLREVLKTLNKTGDGIYRLAPADYHDEDFVIEPDYSMRLAVINVFHHDCKNNK